MEYQPLFKIPREAVESLIAGADASFNSGKWSRSKFDELPTSMLFAPSANQEGSLHYMHFPPAARQRFHFHPSPRYLLLIGDVAINIYYNYVGEDKDPRIGAQRISIPALTMGAIRFKAGLWHRFETRSRDGLGVLAFSFHGNDGIVDLDQVNADLMHEITTFFEEGE